MSHPWYSGYDEGVPHEVDVKQYASIIEILEEGWEKYANLPSFHCMGKSYTYADRKSVV